MSYLLLGLVTGILGGLLGIGGASLVVPALVMLYGFSQHDAQGTILAAMVPPIGLLAAWRYWHVGHVKLAPAAWIALGFFLGGYLGAVVVEHVPDIVLKRVFGVYLLFIAVRMIWGK
ncbi:MAG: TSUP family transporter [Deltaproteobacteria bacterium]